MELARNVLNTSTMTMRRRLIMAGILLSLLATIPVSARPTLRVSTAAGARLALASDAEALRTGPGGSIDVAVETGTFRVGIGAGVYAYSAPRAEFSATTMVLPHVGVTWAPISGATVTPTLGVAYRHYIAWYTFVGDTYLTSRPVLAATIGADIAVGPVIEVGPFAGYEAVFDARLRHVAKLGIRVTVTLEEDE